MTPKIQQLRTQAKIVRGSLWSMSKRVRLLRMTEWNNDCLVWQGYRTGKMRYGILTVRTKRHYAHRLAYEVFIGHIPESKFVCHRCDNPACINPKHLFLGTSAQNSQDCAHKGRHSNQKFIKAIPPRRPRPHKRKLSESQALALITKWHSGVPTRDLAVEYSLHRANVVRLVHGHVWYSSKVEKLRAKLHQSRGLNHTPEVRG